MRMNSANDINCRLVKVEQSNMNHIICTKIIHIFIWKYIHILIHVHEASFELLYGNKIWLNSKKLKESKERFRVMICTFCFALVFAKVLLATIFKAY
jgi:hypothetical protein